MQAFPSPQSEHVHLMSLSAALAHATGYPGPGAIFDDLNFRAHRLKGAAATFGSLTLRSQPNGT